MGVRPLPDKVLVVPDLRLGTVTPSGLHLARPPKQGVPVTGTIHAVGSSVKHLKPGQKVVIREPKPHGFEYDSSETLFNLDASQIIATLD